LEETTERVQRLLPPLLDKGIIPVVTGFIGATREGAVTTLGRGSSDMTATLFGRCLPADEVWIWTDVDGVMTADPRIVPEACTLPDISYGEVAELSYFGAKVLHPLAIQPVVDLGIPVRVLNSLNPEHPGTLISSFVSNDLLIKSITAIRDLSLITVQGRGMQGVPGVAGRVFSAVAESGASVLMITQSSSEQNICFWCALSICTAR
jgi:bifunctional aspartokinase / homoserine dehydrogenase 1